MVTINANQEFHTLRKLEEGETLNSFNCGDAELDEFILSKASEYRKTLLAVSYVLEENGNPIAYFPCLMIIFQQKYLNQKPTSIGKCVSDL